MPDVPCCSLLIRRASSPSYLTYNACHRTSYSDIKPLAREVDSNDMELGATRQAMVHNFQEKSMFKIKSRVKAIDSMQKYVEMIVHLGGVERVI